MNQDQAREMLKGLNRNQKLTPEEWQQIVTVLQTYSFPCSLQVAPYGFSFVIFAHHEFEPLLERPQILLQIDQKDFPFPSASLGFAGQEQTLSLLSPLTHSARNQELLDWYGLPKQSPLTAYTY